MLPSRTDIALAVSFTSESNPQLPIATYRRVASGVVTAEKPAPGGDKESK